MKKNIVTLLSVLTLSAAVLAGCGEATEDAAVEETSVETSVEAFSVELLNEALSGQTFGWKTGMFCSWNYQSVVDFS